MIKKPVPGDTVSYFEDGISKSPKILAVESFNTIYISGITINIMYFNNETNKNEVEVDRRMNIPHFSQMEDEYDRIHRSFWMWPDEVRTLLLNGGDIAAELRRNER